MSKRQDVTGQIFGRLTAVRFSHSDIYRASHWECLCSCGNSHTVNLSSLKSGAVRSCGCFQKEVAKQQVETHGMCGKPEYRSWAGMVQRCTNPNAKHYDYYGGRGIAVCTEWLESFENFYRDMGDRPAGCSLDRIDSSGNYCKENCRWSTASEQQNNMRSNRTLTYDGRTMTVAQWIKELNLNSNTTRKRLRLGWTAEEVLTTPVGSKQRGGS
jgi:hypothetical protein